MDVSSGGLIWLSAQPILRLYVSLGASKTVLVRDSSIAMISFGPIMRRQTITIPMLMFSKIVPAISAQNISALGPLFLVALLYGFIGMTMSWFIKQVFWVPHRFRNGILVAGGWSNVGDITTSVVLDLMATAPFKGTQDEDLAVAYVASFLLTFFVTLFPLGGTKLIEMDFHGPDVTDAEVQLSLRKKQVKIATAFARLATRLVRCGQEQPRVSRPINDVEASPDSTGEQREPVSDHLASKSFVPQNEDKGVNGWTQVRVTSLVNWPKQILASTVLFFGSSSGLPSISIVVSFLVAVIPQAKALFVPVPGVSVALAPDGQPPLAVVLNTATFIGAASAPLGLVILGSAIARLKLSNGSWRELPLGSISALTSAKLIIMPVLGILICQSLTHVGVIDAENKVLRFVCMSVAVLHFLLVKVVFLTQAYADKETAAYLPAYLLPQYLLMFFSMTGLITYTLHLLYE
ncbi:hypothetical protein ID866_5848 [Astraeus odoratus]|nr:hypothetical protein ID866_5848 [Astraeus odoratus]